MRSSDSSDGFGRFTVRDFLAKIRAIFPFRTVGQLFLIWSIIFLFFRKTEKNIKEIEKCRPTVRKSFFGLKLEEKSRTVNRPKPSELSEIFPVDKSRLKLVVFGGDLGDWGVET